MNHINKVNHVDDDGSVYVIKGDAGDIDEVLDYEINFEELNKKYKFSLKDKDLILQASLELERGEPDLELLKKAIALIAEYKSALMKKEQSHLRHAQAKDEEVPFSSDLNDDVWQTTLLALFLGPIGLLKVSWGFALLVGSLSAGMFVILPELLASIPLISAAIAWISVNRKIESTRYRKKIEAPEVVFKTGEEAEESVLSNYRDFLKKRKTIWLAAVLGFVFSGFGLFYVSWVFALGMFVFTLACYMSFPILLIATPFISLGLALYAATETNAKLTYRHLNP